MKDDVGAFRFVLPWFYGAILSRLGSGCRSTCGFGGLGVATHEFDDVAVFFPDQPRPLFRGFRPRGRICKPRRCMVGDDQGLRQPRRRNLPQPEAERRMASGVIERVPESRVQDSPCGGILRPGSVALMA